MKIAMIGDFLPRIGGVSSHIYTLSKKLVEKGHEVFVITYSHKNLKDIDKIHVTGAKIIDKPFIRPLMFKLNGKRALENLIKKEKIDIIHGHTLVGGGLVASQIGYKYKIPTYVTVHGSDILVSYKNPFWKKMIENVLDKADKVLTVSNYLKKEVLKTNVKNINKKTFIHFNTININKFKEAPNRFGKEKLTIIFVGVLIKRKNVDILLDAKKQTKTDFNLIIVGDGPEYNNLKNRVKNENISDVTFCGSKNNVNDILPKADLFVLPSFTEGLSIALIEALACGLPVIGSNIGGMNEVITKDVGLLIDPYDPTSLSNAIDNVLTNKNLYNKFKSNARKKAIEFSKMKIPYKELK